MKDKFSALGKYNFWKGNVPELGFKRLDYTNKIFDYVGNKLIKVLVGQRRAGKSYILRQIAQRLINEGVNPQNIFYINKEFTDFDFIENYKDLDELLKYYREALKPSGKIYLFVDEIQNVEDYEKLINAYRLEDNYSIFLTGSNNSIFNGKNITKLTGRYIEIEVLTLNFLLLLPVQRSFL